MRNENVRKMKQAFILFPLNGHREVKSYNSGLGGQQSFYLLAFSKNPQPLYHSEAAWERTTALEESQRSEVLGSISGHIPAIYSDENVLWTDCDKYENLIHLSWTASTDFRLSDAALTWVCQGQELHTSVIKCRISPLFFYHFILILYAACCLQTHAKNQCANSEPLSLEILPITPSKIFTRGLFANA